jgi:hypothetical protein
MSEADPFSLCIDCKAVRPRPGRLRCTPCMKGQDTRRARRLTAQRSFLVRLETEGMRVAADWFTSRPDDLAAIDADLANLNRRVRKYGLGLMKWARMIVECNSSCAICGTPHSPLALAIDHDHHTGAVRGLLCVRCNTGLGMLRMDGTHAVRRAESVRRYLAERTPLVEVIDKKLQLEEMMACVARGERLF